MEHTYQYAWIIPFLPLPVPVLIGFGLLLFPTIAKSIRRIWAFTSTLLLSIAMVFSANISIYQINGSSSYQYLWSWMIHNDFSLEFGYFIDPLTSIMFILITTVGIMVLIYSDNYMSHDQGYLRFFAYLSFFNSSMLGLVTSSNLIQIYFFWELVGMSSYLLIGFWFTRPIAASACQKAFVTNRVGDFGLLLGIIGFYWITGSVEFRYLFKITENFIQNNEFHSLFATLCASLLFLGAIAKSAQFPLHVWLPDAMEGPTPISALIHAATMVAAGIFLVARLIPLFICIPYIMNFISFIGILTLILGATLALAQRDIKRSLAYSTMSQLGYIMLALGIGSYRAALFHLITHAYSKALLFLGSGSIIHSMEPIVGYSPEESQNMVLMGGLQKYVPITRITFLLGTLSLCGIPPFACFWSKDEILNGSWLYSSSFAIPAYFTAGLTGFYMFRVYLLTFDGYLRIHFQDYSSSQKNNFFLLSLWGKKRRKEKEVNPNLLLSTMNNRIYSFSNNLFKILNGRNKVLQLSSYIRKKYTLIYPHESDNLMLFPLIILVLFTLFVGLIGIPFYQGKVDILSEWLTPLKDLLYQSISDSVNNEEFFTNAIYSLSIALFGLIIAYIFYGSAYSFFHNFYFINFFVKSCPKLNKMENIIYNWSYNRGYIDLFYTKIFTFSIRKLTKFTEFFDQFIIDGIINGVGVASFFIGEGIKYIGGGRISSYLFFYLSYVSLYIIIRFFFVFGE
uniref:NADH-plastoquinone oxidoreductase subunit 5 n=1 Tax=Paepalanthus alpinus TaxID=1858743 RepID=UPI001F13DF33|nr:NADH-plastoquinone oxidoreductase subunit 5 [Paepalanthus alpinus]ULQ67327.1 NADH-plastoquinone oxidoreductase subunit 5 [Paepalanthus alpinus]